MKTYYVYILASGKSGTLYIGVTSNLVKRVYEHKKEYAEGFTKKYHVKNLVYFEMLASPGEAIAREKQLKAWRRDWKIELIESANPSWEDLYSQII